MNTAINTNLVHESEAQRQFARVKIPAKLIVIKGKTLQRFKLADISAGGFSFIDNENSIGLEHYSGRIEFSIEGFSFVMPVQFDAKTIVAGRVGCCFQGMSASEISSLRHIIAAFLSGDLVTSGDMLNILSRDNFTKSRNNKVSQGLSGLAKLKAIAGSALFLLVGVLAFLYIGSKVSDVLFVAKSTAAEITIPSIVVTTPREGVINFNVKKGDKVTAGQVLGTFSSPLFSYLSDSIGIESLTPEVIEKINEQSFSGGLVSPCDCVVADIEIPSNTYAAKATPLITLVSPTAAPHIEATFSMRDFKYLQPGKELSIDVAGQAAKAKIETVETIRDAQGNLRDLVKVIALPTGQKLSMQNELPAQARINRLFSGW